MNNLSGKKILFICPRFFGYEQEIELELTNLGATVDYFNERPFTSSIAKILNRLNYKSLIKRKIDEHYNAILERASRTKYDVLFVVNPETMSFDFVRKIKQCCLNIQSVLYLWDSIKNKKNALPLIDEFERVVTFDELDAEINQKIEFLPLFYTKAYDAQFLNEDECADGSLSYNLTFIGTAHSDRYLFVNKILMQFATEKMKNFIFFYCPSRLLFALKKIASNELVGISRKEVSFNSMSTIDIVSVLKSTKFVIDIEHPSQNGLTMRTIEMLGLKKKLITTNKNIKNYDFYHPNNVCVVDRENPNIDGFFLVSPYHSIEDSIREKYALKNWLITLLR